MSRKKPAGLIFVVVRAYWCAVLLWAAVQKEINMFVRDPTASSLEWRVVLDFAAWEVCSVSILSPLHCVMKDSLHWFPPRPQPFLLRNIFNAGLSDFV